MKSFLYILVLTVFVVTAATEVSANDEGTVLCRMLESSLNNPWNFDAVIKNERNHIDNATIRFIKEQENQLYKQAIQREAYCEPLKNKSMVYDLCIRNNPARELASWLESVSQAINGLPWKQTEFGKEQLKVWDSCNNPALCEQLRLSAANESRQVCPDWLANK